LSVDVTKDCQPTRH